ncbi:MAG TPA: Asp-tRNA(Asn)/Glu-tRNA(Gln) amidotransferase subunit GatC [Pyrinomonadaceae bacterium]|nr:Asp-tRNA(Asn)/Glu-tRNA(Gln) amidotransferase subunit GatC [Pyrinomonadaceae bacterium]
MDVKHVANLAHIAITEEEAALYGPQLAGIVEYVEQLNTLDTTAVEPMLGGLTAEGESTRTIRADEPRSSFTVEEAVGQAPDPVAGHFRVPKVL